MHLNPYPHSAVPLLACLLLGFAHPARALVISYQYDSAARLGTVNYGGTSNTSYTYDSNGNLLARADTISPFVPLAGNYTGLITASPASNAGTGIITLSLTLTGGYTGKVILAGKSFKVKGTFDANGDASLDLPSNPAIHISLHIDPDTQQITGDLSGGAVATLTAFEAPFGKKSPAPGGAVGKFTGLFYATESVTTVPKGTGFGTITIGVTGSVKLAGTLADGSKVSQGTSLVSETQWPLFASLYKNLGFVSGIVEYSPLPETGDFAGTLDWLKPTAVSGLYQGGFATQLELSAARYMPPAKSRRVLDLTDTSPNGEFIAPDVAQLFTLDTKNKIVVSDPNPEKLALKLNVRSGTVSGSLLIDGKSRKLSGLIQLQQNTGEGFFLTDSESLPYVISQD